VFALLSAFTRTRELIILFDQERTRNRVPCNSEYLQCAHEILVVQSAVVLDVLADKSIERAGTLLKLLDKKRLSNLSSAYHFFFLFYVAVF
jgi:hypothetical protein